MKKICDVEVWPLYDGENITVAFIDGRGDDANDLLIATFTHDEARALADILLSAARSESDTPTYALRAIWREARGG